MTVIQGGFTPIDEDNAPPVLVERKLFEELVHTTAKANGKSVEIGEYHVLRGTLTYCEATIYDLDPVADPLTVGQDE